MNRAFSLMPLLVSSLSLWFAWWLFCPFLDLFSGINELKTGVAASCVSLTAAQEEEEKAERSLVSSSSTFIFHFHWIPRSLWLPLGEPCIPLHCQYLNPASLSQSPYFPINTLSPLCFRKFVRAVGEVNCASWQVCKAFYDIVDLEAPIIEDLLFCSKVAL